MIAAKTIHIDRKKRKLRKEKYEKMNLTVKWLLNVIIMLQWQFIFGTCGHFIINAIFWTESSYKREKRNEEE